LFSLEYDALNGASVKTDTALFQGTIETNFIGTLNELILKIGRLGDVLKDPLVSSVRLVLNPDRIAIAETPQPDPLEPEAHGICDLVFRNLAHPQTVSGIVIDGHPRKQRIPLEDHRI